MNEQHYISWRHRYRQPFEKKLKQENMSVETGDRLRKILAAEKECMDCGKMENVDWTSLGFGTIICLECAGIHRRLGVHITLVQSLTLDDWDNKIQYLDRLERGGNKLFKQYLETLSDSDDLEGKHIFEKYQMKKILYYKEILNARVEGKEANLLAYSETEIDDDVKDVKNTDYIATTPIHTPDSKYSNEPTVWSPDREHTSCEICTIKFTVWRRRHHCRRCGKCVCSACAPKENTRPIMEWGLKEPVRHCKECFQSPSLTWT
jgi:hypothetical protein